MLNLALLLLSIGPDVQIECDLVDIDGKAVSCWDAKDPAESDVWVMRTLSEGRNVSVGHSGRFFLITWETPAGVRYEARCRLIRFLL